MSLQEKVIHWWFSGQNYQEGIRLYSQTQYSENWLFFFLKKKEKYGHGKLTYELTKAVGLDRRKMNQYKKDLDNLPGDPANKPAFKKPELAKPAQAKRKKTQPKEKTPVHTEELSKQYPKTIRRLKHEYGDLYNQRSVLHKQLRNMSPENSYENMNNRSLILFQMEQLTDRLEFLYEHIEHWKKTGIEPLEDEVWPKKQKKELPDDLDELKKMKKNLQSANTKDRNMLDYQQNSKGKKSNPLPDGHKRKKINFRIKKRLERIEEINLRIVKLENAL